MNWLKDIRKKLERWKNHSDVTLGNKDLKFNFINIKKILFSFMK